MMRRDRGLPLRLLATIDLEGNAPYSVSGVDPDNTGEKVPAGSVYRVVVIDPIGRESSAAETVLA
ncbi:hypothetical protein FSC37_23175 [Piscinibacter aquaticus]|uniref:Uncharacterized protein n=1 Tax=Piscinibacter aquaticus TaxID=392597 RepID=A0A5C6TPF7_9BURK|nr:hypothetical protein FSC37_23175 [Piscinibacter aquaticus]